jgi:hypothetical protein
VSKESFRLDSPLLAQWEYASGERLRTRNEAYRRLVRGLHAEDVGFEAVAEVSPRRVLQVGCGTGASFSDVQRRDAGTLVFADAQTLREYIASTITRAQLAENVPK